jgi:hypothetical protein
VRYPIGSDVMKKLIILIIVMVFVIVVIWTGSTFSWDSQSDEENNIKMVELYNKLNVGDAWQATYAGVLMPALRKSILISNCGATAKDLCGVMPPKQNINFSNYILSIELADGKISFLTVSNPQGEVISHKGINKENTPGADLH